MKQVLAIQKKSSILDYMELVLGSNEDIYLQSTSSASAAIELLDAAPSLDCIFIGSNLELDRDIKELTSKITSYMAGQSALLIGSNNGIKKLNEANYIHPKAPIDKILALLTSRLGFSNSSFSSRDFIPLPTKLCLSMQTPPCDIHVKIGSGDSSKYLKRFKGNEDFEMADVEAYLEKNMARVYVHRGDIEVIEAYFKEKLQEEKNLERNLAIETSASKAFFNSIKDSMDYVSFMGKDLGMQTLSSVAAEAVIDNLQDSLKTLNKETKLSLKDYFQGCLHSRDDFSTKHVSLTSIIAANMVEDASWGTREMVDKVVYAAAFQDFSLKGEQRLLEAVTYGQLETLPDDDQIKVMNHARESAHFVSKIRSLPHGVNQLIMEQHGSRGGTGFPTGKIHSSKLSAVLRVASEFSLKLLSQYENEANELEIQTLLKEEFERAGEGFKDIFDLLQDNVIA